MQLQATALTCRSWLHLQQQKQHLMQRQLLRMEQHLQQQQQQLLRLRWRPSRVSGRRRMHNTPRAQFAEAAAAAAQGTAPTPAAASGAAAGPAAAHTAAAAATAALTAAAVIAAAAAVTAAAAAAGTGSAGGCPAGTASARSVVSGAGAGAATPRAAPAVHLPHVTPAVHLRHVSVGMGPMALGPAGVFRAWAAGMARTTRSVTLVPSSGMQRASLAGSSTRVTGSPTHVGQVGTLTVGQAAAAAAAPTGAAAGVCLGVTATAAAGVRALLLLVGAATATATETVHITRTRPTTSWQLLTGAAAGAGTAAGTRTGVPPCTAATAGALRTATLTGLCTLTYTTLPLLLLLLLPAAAAAAVVLQRVLSMPTAPAAAGTIHLRIRVGRLQQATGPCTPTLTALLLLVARVVASTASKPTGAGGEAASVTLHTGRGSTTSSSSSRERGTGHTGSQARSGVRTGAGSMGRGMVRTTTRPTSHIQQQQQGVTGHATVTLSLLLTGMPAMTHPTGRPKAFRGASVVWEAGVVGRARRGMARRVQGTTPGTTASGPTTGTTAATGRTTGGVGAAAAAAAEGAGGPRGVAGGL
jgi:hypothetical protein